MLRSVRWWRHLVVGSAVASAGVLAITGLVGEPRPEERFDAKFVIVAPADPDDPGDDGLRITEVIDQDFADEERRGHERFIPTDFGVPLDVTASSPTAPDQVRAEVLVPWEMRIRIGDPNVTISGQHRYVLGYTLPEAQLSTGQLALDIIGTDETAETGRFEVVVTGFDLGNPTCNVGRLGAVGGCELTREGEFYRAVIEPLPPGHGITIGGTITGRTPIVEPEIPPPPPIREQPDRRLALALAMLPFGFASAFGVNRLFTRWGRNEVYAGGAADAAFGDLPPPGQQNANTSSALHKVSDVDLEKFATIEFVPPSGLEPWQGAVLQRERVNDASVAAWFAGLIGAEILEVRAEGKTMVLEHGPRIGAANRVDAEFIRQMFGARDRVVLGVYSKSFADTWAAIRRHQSETVAGAGWWRHLGPGPGGRSGAFWLGVITIAGIIGAVGLVVLAFAGVFSGFARAIGFGALMTAFIGVAMYDVLLPSRSAQGSALTLRTESFRRFLAASEGQHVDWAWERGVIREYSAWAVALGAAEAWSKAIEASAAVPDDPSLRAPLLIHTMGSALASTRVDPSSGGSSGSSGGFSGGRVGGGGGGGRSGSW